MLSNRQQLILTQLLQASSFVTTHALAKTFHLSERTIQYDIEYIETMASVLGYRILRSKSEGIKAISNKQTSMSDTNTNTYGAHFHFSKAERQTLMKLTLLERDAPVTTKHLADELRVSRRTVMNDMKELAEWLSNQSLELQYIHNKGYVIVGDETLYRQTYARLLHDYYDNMNDVMVAELNAKTDLKHIREIVIKNLKRERYTLVQMAIEGLILHILIAVRRVKQNNSISSSSQYALKDNHPLPYLIAKTIKSDIESHFDITFPDSEIDLMVLHLLASKRATLNDANTNDTSLQQQVMTFVERIGSEMGVAFFTDHKLIQGLHIHLSPAIYRLQNGLHQTNPLHDNIVQEYQALYDVVRHHVSIFEEAYGIQFHAHEMSYVTLHVASSFERLLRHRHHKLKVVVVCGSGVGTSQLLNVKLSHMYPEFDIIDAYSIYDITEAELCEINVDLVVSTVPITYTSIQCVAVSPLLTQGDMEQLNSIVNAKRAARLIQPTSQKLSLRDVLGDRFYKVIHTVTYEQAIAQTVLLLEQEGIVNDAYTDEILEKRNTLGPYMVISPHIALIHGSTTHVHGVGMSMVHFEKGVLFEHPHYDPVYVVICLATENTKVHLNALKQLTELLSHQEIRQQLIDGKFTEFKQHIKRMEGDITWL